jgi:hypothetical protein
MRALIPFLFLLACPLMMIFMMRGMHGSGNGNEQAHSHGHEPKSGYDAARDERIAELEREVAALRDQRAGSEGRIGRP